MMIRPHLSALTLPAALTALLASPGAEARTLAEIKASGVLHVATSGNFPPFTAMDGDRYLGFEPELMEAAAARLGVRVNYQIVPNEQLAKALQDDRVDVAFGAIGIDSTRASRMDFTLPTACSGVSVVSLDPKLNKHTDLVGKTVGGLAGSATVSFLQKLPFEKRVNVYTTPNDIVLAVLTRSIDATFAYSITQPALKKTFSKGKLYFGPDLWVTPMGFAVREGNDGVRLALNGALSRLMQGGVYGALSNKYFGKDVRCKN